MKKPTIFIMCVILTVTFLSIVQVAISNRLSTTGLALSKIEEERTYYKRQNSLLEEKFLLTSSLINVASQASELGFIENKSEMFLTTPLPLAVRQ